MSSVSEPKERVELSDSQLQTLRATKKASAQRWDWITSLAGTVLAALLGLFASAVSISDSFPSLINSISIRRTYVWFIAGVLAFQFLLIFLLWIIKKKNRDVVRLKEHLVDVYLSALNRSSLNPNRESSNKNG